MARKQPKNAAAERAAAERAATLAEYAAKSPVAAEQRRIKTKQVERSPLNAEEMFHRGGRMLTALAESLGDAESRRRSR